MAQPIPQRSAQMRRVQIARATLLLDNPFFGMLALGLDLSEDPTCDTAWTDGVTLGFNPAFVDSLDADQLLGLIAHEVLHPSLGHCWRMDGREHERWNIAADHAINLILTEAGFKLPPNGYNDPQYHGKAAEWIYDRLPSNPQGNKQGNGKSGNSNGKGSPCGPGECRPAPKGTADQPAVTESDWQSAVKSAVKAAQGKLPASIARQVADATKPVADWRALLRRFITEACKADYSWQRPNTRYIAGGVYLPCLKSEAMGKIIVAVDTSGSIDSVLLGQFASEINAIVQDTQPSQVDVIYCDAKVHKVNTFERGDMIIINAVGGGGTDFTPVFQHVDREGETPAVLVYLTDLYGSFPAVAPDYPVLWAVYSDVDVVPFGEVVPCQ